MGLMITGMLPCLFDDLMGWENAILFEARDLLYYAGKKG